MGGFWLSRHICIKYAGETVRQTRDNNLLEKILAKVIGLEGRLKMERLVRVYSLIMISQGQVMNK